MEIAGRQWSADHALLQISRGRVESLAHKYAASNIDGAEFVSKQSDGAAAVLFMTLLRSVGIADHPAAETEDILDIMEQHEAHGARTVYTHTVQCSFPAHNCCGLVEWIVVVAQEIQLQPDTLHLAVDVMERFLSVVPVQWGQHLLAGAASLWIAR